MPRFKVAITETVVFTYAVEAADAEAGENTVRELHSASVKQEGKYESFAVEDVYVETSEAPVVP